MCAIKIFKSTQLILFKNILTSFKTLLLFCFLITPATAQQNKFHSPENIKLFADYLFCDQDYLRSLEEYQKYLKSFDNDTVKFKIGLGYSRIGDFDKALGMFSSFSSSSVFYDYSILERLKLHFLKSDYENFFLESGQSFANPSLNAEVKRFHFTVMLLSKDLSDKKSLLSVFEEKDQQRVSTFYELKNNPPYKSELLAGVLSTVVPGLGKIYTRNYGDGVTAFLLTGIFAYLAYDNFKHDHDARAWIFSALGVGFYAGNIYGSVASAQIFNARVNFEFSEGIKLFIEEKNYFIPDYEFCK